MSREEKCMKKDIKSIISILLSVLMVLSLCGVSASAAEKQVPAAANASAADWMQGLDDNKKLSEINLPGTHDSAMAYGKNGTGNYVRIFGIPVMGTWQYARTQCLTLEQQLNAGVRFFDLRFSSKSDELRLCHGNMNDVKKVNLILAYVYLLHPLMFFAAVIGLPFVNLDTEFYAYEDEACTEPTTMQTVLELVKTFLREYPGETLVLKLKNENGENTAYVPLLKQVLEELKTEVNPSTGKPYLYLEQGSDIYTKMPTLSQVRGQFVLLYPEYEEIGMGGNIEMPNDTGEGSYSGEKFHYHNHWDITGEEKLAEVKDYLQHVSRVRDGKTVPYGSIIHTSSNVVMKDSPEAIEKTVGAWLYAKGTLQRGYFYGWFLCDFVTAEKSAAIWKTNF